MTKKYARIDNETTKECSVGIGDDADYYKSIGFVPLDVVKAYNGSWYLAGYVPEKPRRLIIDERIDELKSLLKETDYIAAKIAEGAATLDEYAEERLNRAAWRVEINRLEEELKGL